MAGSTHHHHHDHHRWWWTTDALCEGPPLRPLHLILFQSISLTKINKSPEITYFIYIFCRGYLCVNLYHVTICIEYNFHVHAINDGATINDVINLLNGM